MNRREEMDLSSPQLTGKVFTALRWRNPKCTQELKQGCEFGAMMLKMAPSSNCSASTKNVAPLRLIITNNLKEISLIAKLILIDFYQKNSSLACQTSDHRLWTAL